jgi:hypothetical protein
VTVGKETRIGCRLLRCGCGEVKFRGTERKTNMEVLDMVDDKRRLLEEISKRQSS